MPNPVGFSEQAQELQANQAAETLARQSEGQPPKRNWSADNGAGKHNAGADNAMQTRNEPPPPSPSKPVPEFCLPDEVSIGAISSQAAIFLEILRIKDVADEELRQVADDMKAINTNLTKLRAFENYVRNLAGDGKFDSEDLRRLREAAAACGIEKELEPCFAPIAKYLETHSDFEYKSYSTDPTVQNNSKMIDTIKETISTLKDNFNGIQSELQVRLQLTMSKNNQADQLTSNYLTSTNQTANTIIGNIGRA